MEAWPGTDGGCADQWAALVSPDRIQLDMSTNEALVLFEWLTRVNASDSDMFQDQAEQRVCWNLEAMLEPQLAALLARDYDQRLKAARAAVRDPKE